MELKAPLKCWKGAYNTWVWGPEPPYREKFRLSCHCKTTVVIIISQQAVLRCTEHYIACQSLNYKDMRQNCCVHRTFEGYKAFRFSHAERLGLCSVTSVIAILLSFQNSQKNAASFGHSNTENLSASGGKAP